MKTIQTLLAVVLLKATFAAVELVLRRVAKPARTPASVDDWAAA